MNLPFDCQLMCYNVGSHAVASVHLIVPCVFRKLEVWQRFETKLEMGTAFPCVLWYLIHCGYFNVSH